MYGKLTWAKFRNWTCLYLTCLNLVFKIDLCNQVNKKKFKNSEVILEVLKLAILVTARPAEEIHVGNYELVCLQKHADRKYNFLT